MKICQFQVEPGGRICGIAAVGEYCWFHQGMVAGNANANTVHANQPTNAVGTSHTWATTNTSPELAVQQAMALRGVTPTKSRWYSGMRWWKALIAVAIVGLIVWRFWRLFLLLGIIAVGLLLLLGFFRMMGNMNFNRNTNDNANENVNQITVNPTFNPVINVKVNSDE